MDLGNKIKALRIDNQLTQEELAQKLFVTRNAISKWETNKGIPSIENLQSISKLFNISLDDLFSHEDLVDISLENKNKIEFNKNIIYAFILSIGFICVGTVFPWLIFKNDPTAGLLVFAILLPISYILLGILSVLFSMKWPYVTISSALSLTPTYIFFELFLSSIRLSIWPLIYFIIYMLSYFGTSKMTKISIFTNNYKKLSKLFLMISIIITIIFMTHTIIDIIILARCITCSAPWYTALVTHTLFYIVPLVLSYTLYIYFHQHIKRV